MRNAKNLIVRIVVIAWLMLAGNAAFAAGGCAYGVQDNTCVGRVNAPAQIAPTCSTAAGWTTISGATWQGSHFSQPQCNYQPPPSCPSGWQEIAGPSWSGSAWVGLSCQIPPAPGQNTCQYGFASGPTWNGSAWIYSCNAQPQNPAAICTAAVGSANIRVGGNGYSGSTVAGSQFTKYQDYVQVTWQIDGNYNFRWPTWAYSEVYPETLISNSRISMGISQSAETQDSWFYATYTGPTFTANEGAGDQYNTYLAACALSSNGSVDGVTMMPDFPATYDAN